MTARAHLVDYERIDEWSFRGTCRASKKSYLYWPSYLREGDKLIVWEGDMHPPSECYAVEHVNAKAMKPRCARDAAD